MNFLEGDATTINREEKMMCPPENMDRRNEEERVGFASPLIFTHFNSSRLYSEHSGVFLNQSHLGGCLSAIRPYPIGTILFIRREIQHADTAANSNALMKNSGRVTALAEVRWCMPVENENSRAEYKIGVRYL